ncbi:peptidase S53 [Aquirhabdus parva]|uniref:Peptidase S53 n=2 Tax=Aquirhabdus parva TaxID=2283318 RepID=A0A345PBQ3_9GAMM|nr:peptidase S53 [Aquirhabdus parva]
MESSMQVSDLFSAVAVRRVTLLSSMVSVVLMSLSAQAAEPWVSTKTHAFKHFDWATPSATTAIAGAASTAVSDVSATTAVPITLSLKLQNEAQLDKLVSYYLSGSARQYLTPAQFTQQFGPSQAQVDKVVSYLKKSGYTNITVSPNHLLVTATGTAAHANSAFNTKLKGFEKDGHHVFANSTDAQVPQSLGGIVETVLGLDTANVYRTFNHQVIATNAKPGSTTNATPAKVGHNPLDFATIYDAASLPKAINTTAAVVMWGDGTGAVKDLGTYTTANGLGAVATSVVKTGSASDSYTLTDAEWDMDSQTILGAAGGAIQKIIFYTSPDSPTNANVTNAMNRAVTDNLAKVIDGSFGECESGDTIAVNDAIFKQAITQGQTFSISSGDSGAFECNSGKPTSNYTVSSPAVSPYVIAVGGTALYTTGTTAYSSEVVWNQGLSKGKLGATGGGYSKIEAAPAWQSGITASSTWRGLPDVGFDADPNSGVKVYVNGVIQQWGGTSLAAPIFAGLWARLQSNNSNSLPFPAAAFYSYFSKSANAGLLHDVTSGNNGTSTYPGYTAVAGWDASTGFGSFDTAKLDAFLKQQTSIPTSF